MQPRDMTAEDERRLKLLQARRITELQEKLQSLGLEQRDTLLQRVAERTPGVLFDVLSLLETPSSTQPGNPVHWCICGNCREMNTDIEKKCCRQTPENCISNMAHVQYYILDEGVLRLASAAWNDVFAIGENNEPGEDHRRLRHAAYRQYVLWQHGRLGEGNRIVIPSCCVWKIRDKYPDPMGQYTGFRVRRLM